MSNFCQAFFIKAPLEELKERYSDAVAVPDSQWVACNHGYDLDDGVMEPGTYLSQDLSSRWGEVIFFCVDEDNDQFEYEHSLNGEVLRQLCWSFDGATCTWTALEGQPEAWEAQAVFSQESLTKALERIRYDKHGAYIAEDLRKAKEVELRALWEQREYVLNSQSPWADAFTAYAILGALGLKMPPFH